MKALLVVEDPLLRDQLRAGFAACPGVRAVPVSLRRAIELLERGEESSASRFDWIWMEMGGEKDSSLKKIRERNRDVPVMILGGESFWKHLTSRKEDWKIGGFLKLPLDPKDFFRAVGRLRNRVSAQEKM